MCLIDTTDGALMMALYTSTSLARDQIAILYYSIVLSVVTIIAAMAIGIIQALTLVLNVANPEGPFWDGVESAGDHYDIIGASICGSFIVFGILSVLLYRPWRRRIDRKRRIVQVEVEDGNEQGENLGGGPVGPDASSSKPTGKTGGIIDNSEEV